MTTSLCVRFLLFQAMAMHVKGWCARNGQHLGTKSYDRLASTKHRVGFAGASPSSPCSVPCRHRSGRVKPNNVRLFAELRDSQTMTTEDLLKRAKDFVNCKNAAGSGAGDLDRVFDMCASNADVYGLTGESIRPGLTEFFEEHEGLHHEIVEEPTRVGPMSVQYPFTKSWRDAEGNWQSWSSIDPAKPRNKAERLDFDEEGMVVRVSVVEATGPIGND